MPQHDQHDQHDTPPPGQPGQPGQTQDPQATTGPPHAASAPASVAAAAVPRPDARPPRLPAWALLLAACAAVYLLAVWTAAGQSTENSLIVGYADDALIFRWSQSLGPPPLTAEEATFAVGTVLILAVAALRRRLREGFAAVAVAVVTVAAAEVLNKAVLPRPDLVGARDGLTEPGFPSGHVAIAAGLALGAVLVASPRVRPYLATAGALWLAVTGAAVQALYWHRPSDVLGATLLACAVYALATRLLPSIGVDAPAPSRPRALPALTLVAVGALLAGARDDTLVRPLVFSGTAFICGLLLWAIATADGRSVNRTVD
ncbi:phosphatase PAP2 family protein [Streptomyces sp. NPDC059278]|uniref:phosphatase PAP2 family protein n=1 Tax=Streptomyces sp. NPDC059278 TaxID=3346801 RepID=UPI003697589C